MAKPGKKNNISGEDAKAQKIMGKSQPQADNWFQQNPKKTLVTVVLVFLLVMVFGAERLLGFINHRRGIVLEAETERRYIKLREQRPRRQMRLQFPKNHLPYTDNVFTKTYKVDIDENGFIKPSQKYADPDLSHRLPGGLHHGMHVHGRGESLSLRGGRRSWSRRPASGSIPITAACRATTACTPSISWSTR